MGTTTAGLANGGQTAHFAVSYDDSLSPAAGLTIAAQLMDACEGDLDLIESWFEGVDFQFSYPINVQVLTGDNGAGWDDPPDISLPFGYNPTVGISPAPGPTSMLLRYLLVSEVTEMFMASQGGGWYESTNLLSGADEGSKGEGLSRFLGAQFLVANNLPDIPFPGFEVVVDWLNSPTRSNFVDNDPDDHLPDAVTGCTTCFIYFLCYQLGFGIQQIIRAGGNTLGDVFTNLTGRTDGFAEFIAMVDRFYPRGPSYVPGGDRFFPVAHLVILQDQQLPAGAGLNAHILGLDTQALANVVVHLSSDNRALLHVPPSISLAVGTWSQSIDMTAAPVTGGPQSTRIHATYAGTTLTSTVTITPRASILRGQVTDTASVGIADADVLITSDIDILPGLGTTLQLSTDSGGFYATPGIPPHAYQLSATRSGYVPGEAGVTVGLGVPVTTQNFALAETLAFDVAGIVSNAAGVAIVGANVSLVRNSPIPGQLETTTGLLGQYAITMDPGPYDGDYTVYVTAAGYAGADATFTIPNGANVEQDFTLEALGGLSGTVRDTSGMLVAGAVVSALASSARTDASGAYLLPGLEPGVATLTATAVGYDPASVSVMVDPGVVSVVNLALVAATASIAGTVTNAEYGNPLSGVVVRAGAVSATTNVEGVYALPGVPAGQATVRATVLHFQPAQAQITLTDHQQAVPDFQLSSLCIRPPGVPGRFPQ